MGLGRGERRSSIASLHRVMNLQVFSSKRVNMFDRMCRKGGVN